VESLSKDYPALVKLGHLTPVRMDVTKEEDIKNVIQLIDNNEPEFGLYALVGCIFAVVALCLHQ